MNSLVKNPVAKARSLPEPIRAYILAIKTVQQKERCRHACEIG